MGNLRDLDLNLLITLDVLLAERSVTRAARRLHLSQPSVSVQLGKLRRFFDDPLLLPGPRDMRTTTRADALREPLRQALKGLERAVSAPASFDPAEATLTFRIAAADYGASAALTPMLRHLRARAPSTRLAVLQLQPSQLSRQAESGDIDLGLHTLDDVPPGLRSRLLLRERYVLVGRAGHPKLKRRPSLQQLQALEHVVVSPDGGGFVGATDRVLARRGLSRRVVLSVPHFLFALSAVVSTDLVAMMPSRLVAGRKDLRVVAAPVDVPGFNLAMVWHERLHRDPAHQWLREQIAQAAQASAG
ncbi:Transcriptional regulator [Minicystis rosea]|nr:Transcriptional regulator [Minicystis rosea]